MLISASIQAANQLTLLSDVNKHSDKFDQLHIDITDGHFTDNIGLSLDIVKQLKTETEYFLDVHLMVDKNPKFVEKVYEYGADLITVHSESSPIDEFEELTNSFKNIGIGILPTTNINSLIPYLEFTSTVLLLAVNPGFSNQSKVIDLRQRIEELNNIQTNENTVILVDGGVSNQDLTQLQENGVDIAVQGGAIFG